MRSMLSPVLRRLRSGMLALAFSLPATHAASGDDRVLAAKDAVQRGDRARLARQLDAVRGHELEPYVEYWLLSLRLHLLTHSPPPFRLRNIFIDSSVGTRM